MMETETERGQNKMLVREGRRHCPNGQGVEPSFATVVIELIVRA